MHISELGTADYIIKSWMALGGCYLLFVFEKLMDFVGEIKKERVGYCRVCNFNLKEAV
jgi:hypothetical protein